MPEHETVEIRTLNDAAVVDHEMYTSWLKAGFSETQAFTLLQQAKHQAWHTNLVQDEREQ